MDTEAHVRLPGAHGYGGTRTVARDTWIRRHTYGCQGHMDTEANVRLPETHGYGGTRTVARGTWIRRHTYGCQGHMDTEAHVRLPGHMDTEAHVRLPGHMDTEAHVRLPGTHGYGGTRTVARGTGCMVFQCKSVLWLWSQPIENCHISTCP